MDSQQGLAMPSMGGNSPIDRIHNVNGKNT
jgi:hypothetical protein